MTSRSTQTNEIEVGKEKKEVEQKLLRNEIQWSMHCTFLCTFLISPTVPTQNEWIENWNKYLYKK